MRVVMVGCGVRAASGSGNWTASMSCPTWTWFATDAAIRLVHVGDGSWLNRTLTDWVRGSFPWRDQEIYSVGRWWGIDRPRTYRGHACTGCCCKDANHFPGASRDLPFGNAVDGWGVRVDPVASSLKVTAYTVIRGWPLCRPVDARPSDQLAL